MEVGGWEDNFPAIIMNSDYLCMTFSEFVAQISIDCYSSPECFSVILFLPLFFFLFLSHSLPISFLHHPPLHFVFSPFSPSLVLHHPEIIHTFFWCFRLKFLPATLLHGNLQGRLIDLGKVCVSFILTVRTEWNILSLTVLCLPSLTGNQCGFQHIELLVPFLRTPPLSSPLFLPTISSPVAHHHSSRITKRTESNACS